MAPVRVEICGNTFVAKKNEMGGIRIRNTDLGIAYAGTEDGGRVVFARKNYSLNPEHKYDNKEPVVVHQGEEPIVKEIECRSTGGQKKIIKATIAAI